LGTRIDSGSCLSLVSEEIGGQLRGDHDVVLTELDALRRETDERRCDARLAFLRRTWMVHILAEEMVLYKALEAAEIAAGGKGRADARFFEHERLDGSLEKLSHTAPGTLEWHVLLNHAQELIAEHTAAECEMLLRLAERFDRPARREMGRRLALTRDKLAFLEEAKAA
jgi:hypothetical protein